MRSQMVLGASLALALFATESLVAQPPGGGRGAGFGRGGASGAMGLLMIEEVQKELGITDELKEKLTKIGEEFRPQGGGNFAELQQLNEDERAKRMAEIRKQMEDMATKADGRLQEVLSETQWKRLSELRLQREGVSSLARPEIAKQLGLSDEQVAKVSELQSALRPSFGGAGGRGGPGGPGGPGGAPGSGRGGPGGNFEEMRAAREKAQGEILALLSADQKAAWEKMQGAKFEFPQRGPGGFGSRGGEGAGGAPGGGNNSNRPRRPAAQ